MDATTLLARSAIASEQAAPIAETIKKTLKFLDYITTHPVVILPFGRSSMVLNIHSNASYLCKLKAKTMTGGHFFLSNNLEDPRDNGAVLNIVEILKTVMSLAAEAEIGALFLNLRQAIPARTTLIETGHQQPPTPIQVDNRTALGFVGKNITPKATKSTDMHF